MSVKVYDGITDSPATAGNVLTSNGSTAPTMQACSRFMTGSGAPSSGAGFNGDAYFDTAAKNLYLKSSGAWAVISALAPSLATNVSGYLGTTATATWTTSGQTIAWTVPSSVNGQTVTKCVVVDVVARLLSGTPGTAATFGCTISGNVAAGNSRVLPTNGGGVDVSLINMNTQNLTASYKMANAGDTVVFTSGGTFSGSTTWQFDVLGYYVGLTTTNTANVVQLISSSGAISLGASGTRYVIAASTTGVTAQFIATPANTLIEYEFILQSGAAITITAASGGTLTVGATTGSTNGTLTCTGPASFCLTGIPGTSNYQLENNFSGTVTLS